MVGDTSVIKMHDSEQNNLMLCRSPGIGINHFRAARQSSITNMDKKLRRKTRDAPICLFYFQC